MKSFKTIREDIKKVIKGNELFILFSLITIILSVSSLSLAKRSLELDESKTKNMKLDVRVGFDDIDSIDFASIIQIAFSVIEGNSSEDCYFSFVYMPRLVNNNNRSIENLEYDIDVNRLAYINDSNNMVYYKLPDLELSKDFELADTTHLHFKYKKNRINAFCTTDVLFNKIDTTISYMSLNTSLGITHDGIKYKRNIPYSMYYFKKDGLTIKNILDAAFDSIYKDYKYYGIAPDYILLSFNHESVGFRNFEYFNRSKYHLAYPSTYILLFHLFWCYFLN